MGLRGKPPTPTAILKARGSWLVNQRKGEPQPQRGKPNCPAHLTDPQRAVWRRLCRLLDDMGVLTHADGCQLERYAVYYCRWRDCEGFIAKYGISFSVKNEEPGNYIVKVETGDPVVAFVEYPQVKESHRLHNALRQIEMNFGLTPSARARLTGTNHNDGGQDTEAAQWFRQSKMA